MPTHQIPEIDNEEINRVLSMTQNTKALRGKSSSDTTTLLSEINFDFAKTMNKIVFDKHLKEKGNELITGNLRLPPPPPKKLAPYYGMISIPAHNFPEKFSQFTFTTLLNKEEVIKAQQEIKKECNDVLVKDIYNPNITKTMRVDEFKGIQASSISQTSYYLRETWVNKIKEIIKTNFADSGQSWYNLNETSKEAYEMGKLKKFLTQVKFLMQDTLLYMTQSSVKRFTDSIISFLPEDVIIKDSVTVENIFPKTEGEEDEGEQQAEDAEFSKKVIPLFSIDLLLNEESEPAYSTGPIDIVMTIMSIFDKGLKELQEISQIEQKLLPHLFKTNIKMFLKATERPEVRPDDPDLADKRQLPDENTWVFDSYTDLRARLEKAIMMPLDTYLGTYKKYEKEYKLDPDTVMRAMDDEENWPEVDQIRAQVYFHLKEEERLKAEIPESITVSIFKIMTKEIRDTLASKHAKIAKEQIELIAKIAKSQATKL